MKAEVRAFIDACQFAQKGRFWTSTNVRTLATTIRDRYTSDPERWAAPRSEEAEDALVNFFLECTAMLQLIEAYSQEVAQGVPEESRAIGEGTYEGIINRAQRLLMFLK